MKKGKKAIEQQLNICKETLGVMKDNFLDIIEDMDSMEFLIDQINEMYEFYMKMYRQWKKLYEEVI
ncbi:hypothetical protein [Dethiothermospora halolimnae]|uniref:hypothetical protein n=1 Tax=Dethiothermospora halolimnae TaxID=3114390 RepID=UPI003CCC172B